MIRWIFLIALCALLKSYGSAETPSVTSNSGAYDMESTTFVTGVGGQSQSGGVYQMSSELDSNALVPVELSSFEVE